MSILKSIYKVRNRDSQTYDTLHPETEHSQVVDFGQGILSHLQSNVLASAISAMTSDSLFAKMMKLVLDASGVKYSMAQNGYICLGEFFGGLIIQWGTTERPANYTVAAQLPIAYTSTAYIILGIGIVAPDDNNAKNVSNIYNLTTKTSVSFRTENENAPSVRYIAIGR